MKGLHECSLRYISGLIEEAGILFIVATSWKSLQLSLTVHFCRKNNLNSQNETHLLNAF
jgi:hypothetical protein